MVFRRVASLLYPLALCVGVAWALARRLGDVWAFTIDDAGISYAYAKHLAEGLGPVAAPGAPWVEGFSNPLWVALLVPCHWLGWALPEAAKWLGVALFGGLAGIGVACFALVERRPWYRPSAAGALYA